MTPPLPHPPLPHPSESALFDLLDEAGISHETREHPPIFTVEDGKALKAGLPGGHTKNLFLKDKAGQFVLVCALTSTTVRLNKLHRELGTKRLSFGSEKALYELLRVRPGSVTLFSLIHDSERQVRLVLDKALFEPETVWFHPLRNTASTAIASQDILTFAKAASHPPVVIDFRKLTGSA
ncbi:prolyl-tRNA synthetase associated domain-containing protein [Litorimonas sp.]|uniref:prolyl-tRNA synthetase associated domain-containing protein n=1 Tax=Litorimonas sp. TaxID=1892381 RepID=UPI003A856D35